MREMIVIYLILNSWDYHLANSSPDIFKQDIIYKGKRRSHMDHARHQL